MSSPDTEDGQVFGLTPDEAAKAIEDAFGGHGEHGRDIPRNRRRPDETDNRRAPTFDDDPEHRARLESDTDKDRHTYTRAGYQPVECRYCHAEVSVRKNSEKHTSVQWPAEAVSTCPMRDRWSQEKDATCPRMRQSIKHAYAEGILTLSSGVDPEDEEHMVNPLYSGSEENN